MRDRNTLFTNINIGGVGGGCMEQVAKMVKHPNLCFRAICVHFYYA